MLIATDTAHGWELASTEQKSAASYYLASLILLFTVHIQLSCVNLIITQENMQCPHSHHYTQVVTASSSVSSSSSSSSLFFYHGARVIIGIP